MNGVSSPRVLIPGERTYGTHSMRGWVGSTAGSEYMEKKNFLPYQNSNSDPSLINLFHKPENLSDLLPTFIILYFI
jgi:hypothetical protein